ncbi:uncharacterized protein [Palaemon carinicauda]|uniref:uncharacterized protein n=1 Tax=Palaemon carinicauda TaxID=392227 RepID=UPI0035B57C09
MLTVRDTIAKKRYLYLAAALAIVDEQQKRLAEAKEQQKYSFRVEASTICKVIPEVCKAIIAVYKDEVLCCPKTEDEWKKVAARVSSRWDYHNCLGAVDRKHIAIKKPPNAGSYYYNYKGFHKVDREDPDTHDLIPGGKGLSDTCRGCCI